MSRRSRTTAPRSTPMHAPGSMQASSGKFYITAAFRCSFGNQAYLFMHHEYLLMNYDPTTLDGEVIDGPKHIYQGIPCLEATIFGDNGIYCAFGLHHRNEAFIFSGKWCALIGYARDGSDFSILKGPTLIDRMFPFLKGTTFENHVGAAFESATDNEAYLFRGIKYAVKKIHPDNCPFLSSVLPRKNTGVKDEDFVVFAIDDEDYSDLD